MSRARKHPKRKPPQSLAARLRQADQIERKLVEAREALKGVADLRTRLSLTRQADEALAEVRLTRAQIEEEIHARDQE